MRCLNRTVTECAKCRGGPVPFLPASRAWRTSRGATALCRVSSPQSSGLPTPETAAAPSEAADTASLLGTAWDPEGLFGTSTPLNFAAGEQMGDLIARRERERAARRAATAAAAAAASPAPVPLPAHARPLRPLPGDGAAAAAAGGLRPADLPPAVVSELDSLLRRDFMPVDLSWPGVRVLHLDPPVVTVEGFLTGEQCDRMVQAAEASGRMQASRIGASNVTSLYGNASSNRRTSTSMMVTPGVAGPVMDTVVSELQSRGKKLLRADEGPAWGPSGKLPRSGQYCYEALQVARYETGQHFLAHEDGFPPALASSNGFQRHATLLVYLNDVAVGGATRFDHLGLAVRPAKGKALLFFPAFADGTADCRSLHTAEDAVDIKYATQQWIARGLPKPQQPQQQQQQQPQPGVAGSAKLAAAAKQQQEQELEQRERAGRQAKGAKTVAKSGKGFGSKPAK
ncbi:hypothetical protein PLESTB_000779000 [Pleodorina starrii]|uniref:Prolyl 4-hydroxylase alpha subunit domain-containing protein n=1 Tax=Pleodorina starrii TaxID=330485 RepID=A0A9W6BK42_9CHLO|nr:hypothetical protein PLESTM_000505900 [Pleodorina starrii]GLC53711.1 hypothetical protein PLESTB_000779000 [Pleodorina starrii]GLC72894.1 hypothetical protein PLESTF_001306900 [Pleodorina starrii]